jgi:hypothetical protein
MQGTFKQLRAPLEKVFRCEYSVSRHHGTACTLLACWLRLLGRRA